MFYDMFYVQCSIYIHVELTELKNLCFIEKSFHISRSLIFTSIHFYFSASFAFYFLVSCTQSQTSAMISFNIETLSSRENPSL